MNLGEVTMSPKFTVAKLTHSRQNMQVSSEWESPYLPLWGKWGQSSLNQLLTYSDNVVWGVHIPCEIYN